MGNHLYIDGHEIDDATLARIANRTAVACSVAIEMAAGAPDARINYTATADVNFIKLQLTDVSGFLAGPVAAAATHPILVDTSGADVVIHSFDATLGVPVVLFVPNWAANKLTVKNMSPDGTGRLFDGKGEDLVIKTGHGVCLSWNGTVFVALEIS